MTFDELCILLTSWVFEHHVYDVDKNGKIVEIPRRYNQPGFSIVNEVVSWPGDLTQRHENKTILDIAIVLYVVQNNYTDYENERIHQLLDLMKYLISKNTPVSTTPKNNTIRAILTSIGQQDFLFLDIISPILEEILFVPGEYNPSRLMPEREWLIANSRKFYEPFASYFNQHKELNGITTTPFEFAQFWSKILPEAKRDLGTKIEWMFEKILAQKRAQKIKEELIAVALHPRRIDKWLEDGVTIEEL